MYRAAAVMLIGKLKDGGMPKKSLRNKPGHFTSTIRLIGVRVKIGACTRNPIG